MVLQEHVPLAPYTTMGVGGEARFFIEVSSEAEVEEAVAEAARRSLRLFVLGGGSNLLVTDAGFSGLVAHMAIRGVAEPQPGLLNIGAGEDWDGIVRLATAENYAGIECLAGIPGTVGGTPVQNVGAYGQEVAETIVSVRAFDRGSGRFVELPKEACGFRYRQSLFNTTERDRYIVTRVRFQLRPGGEPTLAYADLQRYFAGRGEKPTLEEAAAAVREIRRRKGMLIVAGDPDCCSAGSFFKNPIVPAELAGQVSVAAGVTGRQMPHWPVDSDGDSGMVKLSAAWLLERAGFHKGFVLGNAGVSSRHTLALINRGGATYAEIDALAQTIVITVKEKFCVALEREPVVLS